MPTPKIYKNVLPKLEKFRFLFYLLSLIGLAVLYPTFVVPMLEDQEPDNVSALISGMLILFWGVVPLMAIHNIKNIDNPKRGSPFRKLLGTAWDWYFSIFLTIFLLMLIYMTILELYYFVFN
jgi:hypothetical protein